jgi:hypothetical protein
MIDISDTELVPWGGIRTRLYQFVWEVVLYDGGEIIMSPLIVNVPGGRTLEILAKNVLNTAMKEAMDYARDTSWDSYCCTYTFTVLSDREFMMVESMVNDEAVYLYKLMGETDLRPEVAQ